MTASSSRKDILGHVPGEHASRGVQSSVECPCRVHGRDCGKSPGISLGVCELVAKVLDLPGIFPALNRAELLGKICVLICKGLLDREGLCGELGCQVVVEACGSGLLLTATFAELPLECILCPLDVEIGSAESLGCLLAQFEQVVVDLGSEPAATLVKGMGDVALSECDLLVDSAECGLELSDVAVQGCSLPRMAPISIS